MPDTTWDIGTSSDGTITASWIEAFPRNWTRGSTQSLTFGFGYNDGVGAPAEDRHETLREYLDYAPTVITKRALDGTAYYREVAADDQSLLMSFEPSSYLDSRGIHGLWGVVVGGRDVTEEPRVNMRLELEVFLLAESSEFASRSDVESAREV